MIEIKNFERIVLYASETASDLRAAVVEAVGKKADLGGANLHWADLGGANLGGANLHWANLGGADLGGANLHWADLRWANLGGAILRGANLDGADLRCANLRGANLGGARCSSVSAEKCDRILTASSGSGYQMVFVRHPDGISVHAGCRDFESIAKAREHWREGKGHDPKHLADCLSALDYLTALAKQRGWTLPEEDIEAAA